MREKRGGKKPRSEKTAEESDVQKHTHTSHETS